MRIARDWLAPVLLTGTLLTVSLQTAPAVYETSHVTALVVLYALLALVLSLGVALARGLGWISGAAASFAVGAVLVWHLREQTSWPGDQRVFAVLAALAGAGYFAGFGAWRPSAPASRTAARLAVAAVLFVGLVFAAHRGDGTLRWHLLRHNKLIGTPSYLIFSPPVDAVRSELWASRSSPARVPSAIVPSQPSGSRPNIVVVLVDTLRSDALAAGGGDPTLMPGLNRLSEQGWIFEDVVANATWTRPSVASLITGLRQEEHGAVDRAYRLPEERSTLAEHLQSEGYRTAAFVSNWAAVGRDAGFAQGFDHFEQLDGEGTPYARADRVNDAVEAWLADQTDDAGPFYLYVHYLDPHTPYLAGAPDSGTPWQIARGAYDAELRYADGYVAALIERARGLPGASVVFLTSDHGEEFGEHLEVGHGHSLYEEVLRVPAVLWAPGAGSGRVDDRLEIRDFFDLLLGSSAGAGLDVAGWAAGRNRDTRYASIYSTTPSALHRPYIGSVCMRGIERDGRFLIWSAYGPTLELYDRAADPGQVRNLVSREPEASAALMQEMDRLMPRWVEREPVEHGESTEDLLRKLGYVE